MRPSLPFFPRPRQLFDEPAETFTPTPCEVPEINPLAPSLTTSTGHDNSNAAIDCRCASRSEGKSYPATPKPAPAICSFFPPAVWQAPSNDVCNTPVKPS